MKKVMLLMGVLASAGVNSAEKKLNQGCQLKYMIDRGCTYIPHDEARCGDMLKFMGYCFKGGCLEGKSPKQVLEESAESCAAAVEG
ncbi:MAG: hypothetical protein LBT92_00395 [Rickettsiales bacterium]|jgi:hypothetical protein|nr:hypothetical protein [Rickettsiales bacterium]